MRKADFLQPRNDFSFGRLNKTTSNVMRAPGPAAVAVPGSMQSCWQRNETAVRTAPTAPSVPTEGSQPNMHASNPDPRGERSWSSYLEQCLRFLGCK